jgi:enoyl-CoA hydratase/carnithine racemase
LELRQEDSVVTITLDRSDNNRVDEGLAAELRHALERVSEQDQIRLVVLTANGSVFSTGREEIGRSPSGQSSTDWLATRRVASALAELPVPVIVALNGDATDHGLELALAGDLRLAVTGARLGFSPLSRSTFPWDGGTQRLPRLVGPAWARDMLLTGRMVDAAEAYSIGLVNRVAESADHLRQITADLAALVSAGSPLGARYVKEAISKGLDLTLAQGLHLEADLNVILQSTTDRAEGINSFLEKRSPKFTGE